MDSSFPCLFKQSDSVADRNVRQSLNDGALSSFSRSTPNTSDFNLLVNGGFELSAPTLDPQFDFEVPGWHAFSDSTGSRPLHVVSEMRGGNSLKLDTTDDRHDRIYQDVSTEAGQNYLLSFDLRGEGGSKARSNDARIYFDGEFVGNFRALEKFQTVALELTGKTNGLSRLEIRETSEGPLGGGDGIGPFIDNIQMVPVNRLSFANGNFEQGTDDRFVPFYSLTEIPSWFSDGDVSEQRVKIPANPFSTNGDHYWALDSFDDRYDRVFHSLPTEQSKQYFVAFDARSPISSTDNGNQIRVRWKESFADRFYGTQIWQTHVVSLVGQDGDSLLDLREAPVNGDFFGDGIGPWIDNFRWYELDTQTRDQASAILNENGVIADEAYVNAVIVNGDERASSISFDISPRFDFSDAVADVGDVLNVYIVSPTFRDRIIVDNGTKDGAVFSFDGLNAEFPAGLVQFDGKTVTIDATAIPSHATNADLLFQLINTDADDQSRAAVGPVNVGFGGTPNPSVLRDNLVSQPDGPANIDSYQEADAVKVDVQNIKLKEGMFSAELRLENLDQDSTRQIALLFPNLPSGVQLLNPSGLNSSGIPYVNFFSSIPRGGLSRGELSGFVEVLFDSPNSEKFTFATRVMVGDPNSQPELPPIPPQRLSPGEVLQIDLGATDTDGDQITYSIVPAENMPSLSLSARGILTISPTPNEIGSYSFDVVASDGSASSRQTVSVDVVVDLDTSTRISGTVLNTDSDPLAGITIELGDIQVVTDANGNFLLESTGALPSDTLKIRGETWTGSGSYPFVAEKLDLLFGRDPFPNVNNQLVRPIYLPELDLAQGDTVDPNSNSIVDAILRNGETPAEVFVSQGSLFDQQGNPFFGVVSITEVPRDLTPAALPRSFLPDVVVTVQPGEMVFTDPAELTLPNRAGFADGTVVDLWSINPETGQFDDVGDGLVQGDQIVTTSGGIRNSSWHFFAPPEPEVDQSVPQNENNDCDECKGSAGNFEVELHSGAVLDDYSLVSYQSAGRTWNWNLHYDSLRADPRPIIHLGYSNLIPNDAQLLVGSLEFTNGSQAYQVPGYQGPLAGLTGNEHFWKLDVTGDGRVALQADLSTLPTGNYGYEFTSGLLQFDGVEFNGTTTTQVGDVRHVNFSQSPFGAGWGLSGLQHIVENADGSLLLIDGGGSELYFGQPNSTGIYESPPGDFTRLTKESNGLFVRTFKDQTVVSFNANNQIASIVDRNGNTTTFDYDPNGIISKITDPANLETTFAVEGGRVVLITDPAGRETALSYDSDGNLRLTTDPDTTKSRWTYDNAHRMISHRDKRGQTETVAYDFAGRAESSFRKDGTSQQYMPVQSSIVLPFGVTTDPFNAPSVSTAAQPIGSYVDPNGNVIDFVLDQQGQIVSESDSEGASGRVLRDAENQVILEQTGNGFASHFRYDELGNLVQTNDLVADGSSGREFWLGFLTQEFDSPSIALYVTAETETSGTIDFFQTNETQNFNVQPGQFTRIEVDLANELPTGEQFGSYPIRVRADDEIQVVSFNAGGANSDGYLGLPVQSTGTDYVVAADSGAFSQFMIVAMEDGTEITLTPSVDVLGHPTGQEYQVTLDAGETYSIRDETAQLDLSGTTIRSNHSVSVVSGGERGGQFFVEQLLSHSHWGFQHIVVSQGGDGNSTARYRIYAAEDQTEISVNGQVIDTLDAGQWLEQQLLDFSTISSNKRNAVYQFAQSGTATTVTPIENYSRTHRFSRPGDFFRNTISIVIPTIGISSLTLNGESVDRNQFITIPNSAYSYGQLVAARFDNYLESNSLFSATLYGFHFVDGYAFPGGFSVPQSTSRFEYDNVFNQMTLAQDGEGRVTLYEIDPANGNRLLTQQVIGEVDSVSNGETDDLIIRYTYTAYGLVDTMTDPLGRVTDYDYDPLGRITRVTYAAGTADEAFVRYEYDLAGNQALFVDENGNETSFEYGALNRLKMITEADPDGSGPLTSPITRVGYDTGGNLVFTRDALGHFTVKTYDALSRLTATEDNLGNVTRFSYDPYGNLLATINPLGHTSSNEYDGRNRLVATIDPDGGRTEFGYDLDNNMVSLLDPVGNLTRFRYDSRDRMVEEIDPLGKSIFYKYDAVDNLVSKTDRNGRETRFEYDDVDRLIGEQWLNASQEVTTEIAYQYDPASNLRVVEDAFSKLTFVYDDRDRVLSVDNLDSPNTPQVLVEYSYDGVGNVLTVTDTINGVAGGVTGYQYDGLNRMVDLIQSGSDVSEKAVAFAYNTIGQYTSIDRYSDLAMTSLVASTGYQYDDGNRLTNLDHLNSSNEVLGFYEFDYDNASRISRLADFDGATDYSYDDRSQLTGADRAADDVRGDESYSFDANGNRLESHRHGGGYETGPVNRLISDGTFQYAYDDEGNVIRRTDIATGDYRTFEWDNRNRMVAVTDFSSSGESVQLVQFVYDALDRRVTKIVDLDGDGAEGDSSTHFVYDREDVILDFADADGHGNGMQPVVEYRYLHGPEIDQVLAQESDRSEWLLADHLGTTEIIIEAAGEALGRYQFDDFGNIITHTGIILSRYLFTGREFDGELATSFFRSRILDHQIGRFLGEDSIGFHGRDFNLYRYVGNSTNSFVDHYGNQRRRVTVPSSNRLPDTTTNDCDFAKDTTVKYICAGALAEPTPALELFCVGAIATAALKDCSAPPSPPPPAGSEPSNPRTCKPGDPEDDCSIPPKPRPCAFDAPYGCPAPDRPTNRSNAFC